MATGFKQGFRDLKAFRTKLNNTAQLLLMTSREVREEGLKLIDEGFESRKDPFGKKWQRRKRAYPWPILNKTLAMRRGWKSEGNQHYAGFRNPVAWTKFHQKGTRKMVARKMVPDSALPQKWRRRLNNRWVKLARKHYFG